MELGTARPEKVLLEMVFPLPANAHILIRRL
jgi:hypothetical protein